MSANSDDGTLGVAKKNRVVPCRRIGWPGRSASGAVGGTVEIDETYVGGSTKDKMRDRRPWVLGAISRDGNIRLREG
jgi:hypothetical protein